MKRCAIFLLFISTPLFAAINRDPNGVNVNSQGATTVFITFGGLRNQVPAEAFWCGELMTAAPDIGTKCTPTSIFGRLPLRYDQSRLSTGTFTDIRTLFAELPESKVRGYTLGRFSFNVVGGR